MVNQNFDKFISSQEEHKSKYLGSDKMKKGRYDKSANRGTETSVGAEGRDNLKEQ